MGTFPIETERLIIRPLQMSDVSGFFRIARDDAVKKYVPYAYPISFKDAKNDFREFYTKCDLQHDFYLALVDKTKNKLVGSLIVTQNSRKEFDMSLIIGEEFRGKRYMRECLQAFVNVMKKGSVLLFIIEKSNEASYNLVSKLPNVINATEEGKLSSYVYKIIV